MYINRFIILAIFVHFLKCSSFQQILQNVIMALGCEQYTLYQICQVCDYELNQFSCKNDLSDCHCHAFAVISILSNVDSQNRNFI